MRTATANYTPWTGSYTSTFSTDVVTVTGADGNPTEQTIYHIETPESNPNIYTSWTGSYTSTFSTDVVTVTGADGNPTEQTIYHIETPVFHSSGLSYSNRSSTTAYSSTSNHVSHTQSAIPNFLKTSGSVDGSPSDAINTPVSATDGTVVIKTHHETATDFVTKPCTACTTGNLEQTVLLKQ